jgi:hypothetical protein
MATHQNEIFETEQEDLNFITPFSTFLNLQNLYIVRLNYILVVILQSQKKENEMFCDI